MNSKGGNGCWIALSCFVPVIGMSQALWLNFASINDTVIHVFHVSELHAAYLTLVFPLFFTAFSIPAGIAIDKYGYRNTVLISALVMSIATSIRLVPGSFLFLMIGQVVVAITQAFIVNAIPKFVGTWFDDDQAGLATSLATGGFFIGMLLGLGLPPFLVDALGMSGMLIVFAVTCWASFFVFLYFPGTKRTRLEESALNASKTFDVGSVWTLVKNKQLMILMVVSFLAIGVFNALMTWMQPILSANGITQDQSGIAGSVLIVGGIIGAVLLSVWSDKIGKRKPFLFWTCLFNPVIVYLFTTGASEKSIMLYGALLGLSFLSGYALLLTVVEELTDKRLAGTATGLLMMVGNGGGVLFGVILEKIHIATHHWMTANIVMVALLALTFLILFAVKEPSHDGTAQETDDR